ncbi:ankyrin repeat-containing domain protein, partial [Mycena olivaceomarginata]
DNDGATPLHYASLRGHTDVAKFLIETGADVNVTDKDGVTPLHYTSLQGHTDVAKFLIDKGADVNATNKDRATPLHYASLRGHTDVSKFLTEKGADIDATGPCSAWSSPHLIYLPHRQGRQDCLRSCRSKGHMMLTEDMFAQNQTAH